ncbi:TolC family protein [Alteromonas confluentis]|uniref:WH2 domain-containing protein n=1 Tax=Alteromonas confluentis TaxID=1656094 RepID=A0A1E7Z6Q9_9ALTE|nr:TolC family protein [Alteromonas confluentis]OFC69152.1 hypothetical protein BFC18_20705 [Alteromonas confluentis]
MNSAIVEVWVCRTLIFFTLAALSLQANADTTWLQGIAKQLNAHPKIIAAEETVRQHKALVDGNSKAVYNPSLSADYSREGSYNNYIIGLSQTIDLHDKRANLKQEALLNLIVAEKQLAALRQTMFAQILSGFITLKKVESSLKLADEELERLQRLAERIRSQRRSGEETRTGEDLSILNQVRQLSMVALAKQAKIEAQLSLSVLLPDWQGTYEKMPQDIWQDVDNLLVSAPLTDSQNNPDVRIAKAQWLLSKQGILVSESAAGQDPTIGISTGKNGGATVYGLNFAMPLAVRNDYSANVRAAVSTSIGMEALYKDAILRAREAVIAASKNTAVYKAALKEWQSLTYEREKRLAEDLKILLEGGDITLTEYITSLEQRAAALQAGIDIEAEYHLQLVNWLAISGLTESMQNNYTFP